MTSIHRSPNRGLFKAACALAALGAPIVSRAQTQDPHAQTPTQIDLVVVSATRTPQDPKTIPSSVSLIQLSDLNDAQLTELRDVFSSAPGLNVISTGAAGSQSSLFIRGANANQSLIVVDGIPMNDRAAAYQNFIGGADAIGLDRVEVLRGPQGTLYGSSAMGGVILLDTAHGCGAPSGVLGLSTGSFGTYDGSASVSGGSRSVGYSASLSHQQTDNDRDYNRYRSTGYTARLEGTVFGNLLIGSTVRVSKGAYEEPGSTLYKSPGFVDSESDLVTAYARVQAGDEFSSRLTLGWSRRDYLYTTSYSASRSDNVRKTADWQSNWTPAKAVEVVFGATRQLADNLGGGQRFSDNLTAEYLSLTAKPVQDLQFIGGVRHDEFHVYGGSTTWRTGLSYLIAPTGTTFRSTYGTAFTAPNTDDRYGVPSWGQIGNPNIRPESSRGWDLGVEQSLLSGRVTLGATYFSNKFRDIMEWANTGTNASNPYEGWMVNRARASTSGLETSAQLRLKEGTTARVSYTYLEATNDANQVRLIRRPRHTVDAELRQQVSKEWIIGAGLHLVADRTDTGGHLGGYSTVRAFTSYDLTPSLRLKLRVENALDRSYQEAYGYPAIPVAVYGGAEWRF
jgi:vitamin B12 transporter